MRGRPRRSRTGSASWARSSAGSRRSGDAPDGPARRRRRRPGAGRGGLPRGRGGRSRSRWTTARIRSSSRAARRRSRRSSARLRAGGVVCRGPALRPGLPHARLRPGARARSATFFDALPTATPARPALLVRDRGPDARRPRGDPAAGGRPVDAAGRLPRTVEAMHADGLRVFVDVGARGNLAGFVEDTLRGRPALRRRREPAQAVGPDAAQPPGRLAVRPGGRPPARPPLRPPAAGPGRPRRAAPTRRSRPRRWPSASRDATLATGLVERLRAASRSRRRGSIATGIANGRRSTTRRPSRCRERRRCGDARVSRNDGCVPRHPARGDGRLPRDGPAAGVDSARRSGCAGSEVDEPACDPRTVGSGWQPPHGIPARCSTRSRHGGDLGSTRSSGWILGDLRDGVDRPARTWTAFALPDARQVRRLARPRSLPAPGPASWSRSSPGREVDARSRSTPTGDPVAEHHTLGGRRISALDPESRGLPVLPFTRDGRDARPGGGPAGRRAGRWSASATSRRTAGSGTRTSRSPWRSGADVDPDRPGRGPRRDPQPGTDDGPEAGRDGPVFEGVAVFGDARPAPPDRAAVRRSKTPAPAGSRAESIYDEQWLFHGPALQAVVGIGPIVDGRDRGDAPRPAASAACSATATSPAAADRPDRPRRLHAPARLLGPRPAGRRGRRDLPAPDGASSTIFGDDPPEGADVACRIAIRELRAAPGPGRRRARPARRPGLDARSEGWEDWRFHWPGRYRDGFRQPDRSFLGEPLRSPGRARTPSPSGSSRRPTWAGRSGATSWSTSSSAPTSGPTAWRCRGPTPGGRIGSGAGSPPRRRPAGSGSTEGEPPVYPADLIVEPDPIGPARRSGRGSSRVATTCRPSRSPTSTAWPSRWRAVDPSAARRDRRRADRRAVGRRSRRSAFSAGRAGLARRARPGDDRAEWVARLWCAKEAAAKATGPGIRRRARRASRSSRSEPDGTIGGRLRGGLAAACPDLAGGADPASRRPVGAIMPGPGPWARGCESMMTASRSETEILADLARILADFQGREYSGADRPRDPVLRRPRPGLDRRRGPGRDAPGPLRPPAPVRRADGRPRPPRGPRPDRSASWPTSSPATSDRDAEGAGPAMPKLAGQRPDAPRPAGGRGARRRPDPRRHRRPLDLVPLQGDDRAGRRPTG